MFWFMIWSMFSVFSASCAEVLGEKSAHLFYNVSPSFIQRVRISKGEPATTDGICLFCGFQYMLISEY